MAQVCIYKTEMKLACVRVRESEYMSVHVSKRGKGADVWKAWGERAFVVEGADGGTTCTASSVHLGTLVPSVLRFHLWSDFGWS